MHTVVIGWFGASAVWFIPLIWRLARAALPGGGGLRGPGTIRLWLGFAWVLVASCTLEAALADVVGIGGTVGFGHALGGAFGHLLGRIGTPLAMAALGLVSLPWLTGFRWSEAAAWADAAFGLGLSRALGGGRPRRENDAPRGRRGASVDEGLPATPVTTTVNPMAPRPQGRYARPTVWKPPMTARGTTRRAAVETATAGTGLGQRDARAEGRVGGQSRAAGVTRSASSASPASLSTAAGSSSVQGRAAWTPVEPVAPNGWLRDSANGGRSGTMAAGAAGAAASSAAGAASVATHAGAAATAPATATAATTSAASTASAAPRPAQTPPLVARPATPVRPPSTPLSPSTHTSNTTRSPLGHTMRGAPSQASIPTQSSTRPAASLDQSATPPRTTRAPAFTRPVAQPPSAPRVAPPPSVQETLRNIEENTARWTTLAGASLARRHADQEASRDDAHAPASSAERAVAPQVGAAEGTAMPANAVAPDVAPLNVVPANAVPSSAALLNIEPSNPAPASVAAQDVAAPHPPVAQSAGPDTAAPDDEPPVIDWAAITQPAPLPTETPPSPVEAQATNDEGATARPHASTNVTGSPGHGADDVTATPSLPTPPAGQPIATNDAPLAPAHTSQPEVDNIAREPVIAVAPSAHPVQPAQHIAHNHAPFTQPPTSSLQASSGSIATAQPTSVAPGVMLTAVLDATAAASTPSAAQPIAVPPWETPAASRSADESPATEAAQTVTDDDSDNPSEAQSASNVVRFPRLRSVNEATPAVAPTTDAPAPTPTHSADAARPPLGHSPTSFEFHAPAASSVELPSLDLLERASTDVEPVSEERLAETGALIEQRLQEFKVPVTVVGASAGPVITRFEVEPALGVRGSQIVGLMKDLSRGLGLTSIRVVETIPGKTCMGLELPNAKRQTIRLSEILEASVYRQSASHLTIAMGKDITGHPVVTDLAKAPHMLVAGTTGSGKSVAINAMIVSLLYKATPEDVRLIMIDPKMLELSVYEGIPHLLAPVVTDMKLAANALNWCVGEMEKRYRLMSAVGVRNLAGFNQKIRDAEANEKKIGNPFSLTPDAPEPLAKLPLIVVVIDELADLMMVAGKKIEELIARLAQKARAAGIHLILATQRPSVDVITGLIKANIPTRVAFQVSSKIDSRTILDQMGAESLLGQGDMLFLPPGTGYPQRVHGAFVADEEVHRIVEHLKQFGEPQYEEGILDGPATDGAPQDLFGDAPDAEADPLYDEAVAFVVRTRRASISSVQRQLRIGYNRAARLVEQMEAAGLVSSMGINGTREVLAPGPAE